VTDREMIEARVAREELTAVDWFEHEEDGITAKLGRYRVWSEELEDDGIYEGDVGELTACVVGCEEFRNRRVCFTFTADGYDSGNEVCDLGVLSKVEEVK
jgi:hypothetical protein